MTMMLFQVDSPETLLGYLGIRPALAPATHGIRPAHAPASRPAAVDPIEVMTALQICQMHADTDRIERDRLDNAADLLGLPALFLANLPPEGLDDEEILEAIEALPSHQQRALASLFGL